MGQSTALQGWPEGASPEAVGKRLASHFVTSPHQYATGTLHYSEVLTWYGSLQFVQLTHDTELRDQLVKKFDALMPDSAEAKRIPQRHHVDGSVFGVVSLEIGRETGDQRYLAFGKGFADRQWDSPRPDGLSGETRFWIDDMYMLTILQLEAYRATKDGSIWIGMLSRWQRISTASSNRTVSSFTRPMCRSTGAGVTGGLPLE